MPKEGFKVCPYCAEEIREAAVLCRHCKSPQPGSDPSQLPPGLTPAPTEAPAQSPAERQLQEQVDRLKKFVPAKVMQRLSEGLDTIEEGERRNITVVFADLCGFTALSEKMDPEDLAELMEKCYGEMSRVIEKFDGTIDKFIGDCVMALFGAPIAHEDDPERAIRSALEIRESIQRIGKEAGHDLDLSVGINSGEVVVKSFGDERRADYSALGDAVNLASRLQGKAGRGEVLVSKTVQGRTASLFDWRDLEPFSVKGKAEPITAHIALRESQRFAKEVQLRERVELVKFIGRNTELETLLGNWRTVCRGKRRVAHIEGEAGVGKSRLVYEFFRAAEREAKGEPVISFTGRCLSYGEHMAYFPIIEMVKGVCGITEHDDADEVAQRIRETVERLAKGAGRSLSKAEREEFHSALEFFLAVRQTTNPLMQIDGEDRRRALSKSIRTLLQLVAVGGPCVFVLEDLHWADKASLALIDELLTDARDDISVMVLILARPAMEHRFPGHESFTKISLHELDDKQSSELLLRLCNIESLPTRIEKQILHKTEGNPFYVEEIVLHLRELGMLVEKAGKWRLTGDLDAIEIPETVQGLILARVDRLAVHVRRVLQVASVIGHTFRYRVLEHVAEAQARLENLLSELVDVEYIFERSALPELVYLFKHVVTQEVVYNTLLRRRRSAFHAKVADAVELLYQGRLEEHCELLAHHWYLAGDLAKSRHYLWQAGQKCQRMYANEAAIDFYTKLLGVLDKGELDESERRRLRVETLNELGIVNKIVGDYEASRGHFLAAAEIAAKSEALKPQTAVAERRVGDVLRLMGQLRDASKHLERAAALFEELRDRPAVRGIHQALGVVAQARGKYDTALEHFEAYLKALGQEDGDLHRAYLGHANVGIIHMLRGDLKRAKTHGEKALSIAEEQSDRRAMSEGHHQLSLIALRRGDFDDAKTHSVEAYRLAHDIGYQRVQLMADASMSEIYNFTGELPAAIHHARRAVDFATEHRHADVLALARGNWARSLHLREDHAEAIAMAEQALRDATQFEDHVCQVNALLVLADSHLALGDREEAVRAAREAVKMVEENEDQDMRAQAHRTLAECLSEEGANGEISTLLRSALKAAEAKGDPHDLAWVQYSRARLLKSADTRREALSSARKLAKKLGVAPLLKRLEASPA